MKPLLIEHWLPIEAIACLVGAPTWLAVAASSLAAQYLIHAL